MTKKMNMKYYISIFMILVFSLGLQAQQQDRQEKIKALKIAFFTERIGLSSEEAEIFWPLYNEHEQKKEALRKQERREIRDKIAARENFSEAEANAILNTYLELEESQEELDKEFYLEMAQKLSAAKVLKLFRAEHEFRRRLLREYRKRGGRNMPIP